MPTNDKKLKEISQKAREEIIKLACKAKAAHIGSALSCIDILVALYFDVLRINKNNYKTRDIFILSKAHAAIALYTVLNLKGLISSKKFNSYLENNGQLPGHLDRKKDKWIECSVGSLGHGFNIALGMAYAYKMRGDSRKVYAVIGDGESQEGSIWEGALFAAKLRINNFTAFIDFNNQQGYGRPKEICCYEPVADKWRSFGWDVQRINGHDFKQIKAACAKPFTDKPRIIIADTIKGKGVDFMEDQLKWHYFQLNDELKEQALACITGIKNAK